MKTKNLLIVVLVLCLSLGGSITAFAAEVPEPNIEYLNPSPRFKYVMTASVGLKVSSSGEMCIRDRSLHRHHIILPYLSEKS